MKEEKIYMLNALWFKPNGGEQRYREYLQAAGPLTAALGAKFLEGYKPEQALIGEWNPDMFFVVEWPNKLAFEQLIHNPEYNKIRHLREEALEKSLLIQCQKI